MTARYREPAEFRLAEVDWLIRDREADILGGYLDCQTVEAARQRWHRVVQAGGFTVDDADRFATRQGYHPSELFDDWWQRCADLDVRRETHRLDVRRRIEQRRQDRRRAARNTLRDAEHVEWVKWCDRRDHARMLAEELAAR